MQVKDGSRLLAGEFPIKSAIRCRYVMSGRNGGVGQGVFCSNNMSFYVGDEQKVVMANRRKLLSQISVTTLVTARQVHGVRVFCLNQQPDEDLDVEGYDALVTNLTDVGLMIQQADCQAVLLFDPEKEVIAAVHSGWRGSVQNILAETVAVMCEEYGTRPADLYAKISPSLGPCCAEFKNYKEDFPGGFVDYMVEDNYFDFWQISKNQLCATGVQQTNVEVAKVCTRCSGDYFSYRMASKQSNGVTGRNCSLIYLMASSKI